MKKWICNICGYIHEGDTPPDVCPVCGVGPEEFSLLEDSQQPKQWKCTICGHTSEGDEPPKKCPGCDYSGEYSVLLGDPVIGLSDEAIKTADTTTLNAALNELSYGLYIITSTKDGKVNGQTANSLMQLTSQPPQISICINKRNLTHEYITASGKFAVSILAQEQNYLARVFGFSSGRNEDKFDDIEHSPGLNGCPIIKDCVAYLEAEVIPDKTVDVGTHTLFVAKVTSGRRVTYATPLTYDFYRTNKQSFTLDMLSL